MKPTAHWDKACGVWIPRRAFVAGLAAAAVSAPRIADGMLLGARTAMLGAGGGGGGIELVDSICDNGDVNCALVDTNVVPGPNTIVEANVMFGGFDYNGGHTWVVVLSAIGGINNFAMIGINGGFALNMYGYNGFLTTWNDSSHPYKQYEVGRWYKLYGGNKYGKKFFSVNDVSVTRTDRVNWFSAVPSWPMLIGAHRQTQDIDKVWPSDWPSPFAMYTYRNWRDVKIWEADRLIRHYRPARDLATGEYGFFEDVAGEFKHALNRDTIGAYYSAARA